MLDENKVRLMTRTALYEQMFSAGTIKVNKDYKDGAGKAALVYNMPSGILTYLIAAAIAILAAFEPLRQLYERIGLLLSIAVFLVCGVVFALLYSFFARYMLRRNYERDKGVFWKYSFTKNKLKKIMDSDKKESHAPGGGKA